MTGLDQDFQERLDALIRDAKASGYGIGIKSGYRSPERQAQLYAQALQKYGSAAEARKWVAPPGRSYHNHGLAVDLGYATPEARRWAIENAARYGLHFPMPHENWHIEPIGARGGQGYGGAAPALASGQTGLQNALRAQYSSNAGDIRREMLNALSSPYRVTLPWIPIADGVTYRDLA